MTFTTVTVLTILALLTLYSSVILGLILALRKLGVPPRMAIVLGFLDFAAGGGLWAALAWPLDVITLINFPAVLLGDTLYQQSILYLGDPHSSQAHYTIPWLLRVPQVHFVASVIVWGLSGLVIQLVYNWRRHIASLFHRHHSTRATVEGDSL